MDTLAEVTDVTAYRGVPAAYHEALKSHRGWWAMLSHLSVGNTKTEERLKQIDNLLLLLNKKLLIVIEDPDRGEKAGVSQRCERILALMDRLQQHTSNYIKVIISGGEEVFNKDFRVIEFKERLNTPSKEYAAILNEMVNKLWCPDDCGIVLPNGKPEFSFNDFPFGTPRDVKHVIRDVDALWHKPGELRGEVDLKELIELSFIGARSLVALNYIAEIFPPIKGSEIVLELFLKLEYETIRSNHKKASSGNNEKNEAGSHKSENFNSMDDVGKSMVEWFMTRVELVRHQSVFNSGGVYLRRILDRSDQGYTVNKFERNKDQIYLGVMKDVLGALSRGEAIKNEWMGLLLRADGLNQYFYAELGKPSYNQKDWFEVFKAIGKNVTKAIGENVTKAPIEKHSKTFDVESLHFRYIFNHLHIEADKNVEGELNLMKFIEGVDELSDEYNRNYDAIVGVIGDYSGVYICECYLLRKYGPDYVSVIKAGRSRWAGLGVAATDKTIFGLVDFISNKNNSNNGNEKLDHLYIEACTNLINLLDHETDGVIPLLVGTGVVGRETIDGWLSSLKKSLENTDIDHAPTL